MLLTVQLIQEIAQRHVLQPASVGKKAVVLELTCDFGGTGSGISFISEIEASCTVGDSTYFAARFNHKTVSLVTLAHLP